MHFDTHFVLKAPPTALQFQLLSLNFSIGTTIFAVHLLLLYNHCHDIIKRHVVVSQICHSACCILHKPSANLPRESTMEVWHDTLTWQEPMTVQVDILLPSCSPWQQDSTELFLVWLKKMMMMTEFVVVDDVAVVVDDEGMMWNQGEEKLQALQKRACNLVQKLCRNHVAASIYASKH